MWGTELKELVLGREGVLVVRPDSGDPPVIGVQVLDALGQAFGTTTNDAGFKMLPPYLRIMQGDGISVESLGTILEAMTVAGWAADNAAFGSGGALHQKLHRDTQKCAFKCCSATINGAEVEVFKDPVTDPGKVSKKGKLSLHREGDGFVTKTNGEGDLATDVLQEVFRNGEVLIEEDFKAVRERAAV